MDLDKYINENLDDILNNTEEYITVGAKDTNNKLTAKKVTWKEELEIHSSILDMANEDETTMEEIQNELFEEHYNKKVEKEYLKKMGEDFSDEEEETETKSEQISEHKLNLLNLFLLHYNEKYEKCENYFSNIKNIEKDTSNPMELFFESIIEFKKIKKVLDLDDDEECMDYFFEDNDGENIDKMMEKFPEGQLYCLDFYDKRILSPSILICLNYVINNKKNLFEGKDWNIFNLREN
jgi:hypothetical protein